MKDEFADKQHILEELHTFHSLPHAYIRSGVAGESHFTFYTDLFESVSSSKIKILAREENAVDTSQ